MVAERGVSSSTRASNQGGGAGLSMAIGDTNMLPAQ
jgi:hypothetical protein